ncbi:MAG TPA: M36 family metallopeptidase, partial [Candidatus Limnocylindria bacterium]|nr:M36 family metallopeptidase [Candidatus Limnocylindria bacterium]
KNPLTFRDIDPTQASAHSGVPISPVAGGAADEVHNQGEVWCVALWEMRANLIAKHGWTNGNQLALQLVTDGMNLSPANPNFLQARDAIILADEINHAGANRLELWSAFAKRGLGASATSPASFTTVGLQESFDLPDDLKVFPQDGFTSSGPAGGPFSPAAMVFTLHNTGSNALTWMALAAVNWLDLSLAGGSLTVAATENLSISVNSNANELPIGIYSGVVRFTNEASGLGQSRTFILRVGQPDYFTELFLGDLDVSYSAFTFTPDGSSSFYSVCRDVATNFPTDPAGGTFLTMTDDSLQRIFLTGGQQVSVYGTTSGSVELVSNGFLTLGGNDIDFSESVSDHFQLPRVSALFRDLYPPDGGTISWLQLSNRFVVTFQNVPEYVAGNTNSFQTEWFFDGRIRFTYLQIDAQNGLVGLSEGNGLPVAFQESDFDSYGACTLPLALAEMDAQTEGSGTLTNAGRVSLPFALATNITVMLTSSDASEVIVPPAIVILAGETNGFFDITIIDDAELDGSQSPAITAAAPGFLESLRVMAVNDNESATLGVITPLTFNEGSGVSTQGVVTVNLPVTGDVRVALTSSDETELEVPPSVLIPAGQTSALFAVTLPDDSLIDGPQPVMITATVTNWISGNALVTVTDNEATNLTVHFSAPQIYESAGLLADFGSVQISGALPADLLVLLESSDPELTVTPSITIPAGQIFTPFSVIVSDNSLIDGTRFISVSATAAGFAPGSNTLAILDDESPLPPSNPLPAHLASNVIASTALTWSAGANTTNDVYFGVNPAPGPAELIGTTMSTNWTLSLLAPATTYYWQIISHRTGSTASPIWNFTTRGVHHFAASSVAGTQYVGIPFPITITAKDEFETTVSNFTGTVQFSAKDGSGEIFHADFDSGLNGFVLKNDVGHGNGLWHLTTARGSQPGHSGSTALYYGQNEIANGNGNYDLGSASEGAATSPAINLAGVLPPITLTFNHLIQTELNTNWDHATVEISTNDGDSYEIIAARALPFTSDSGGLWIT